MTGKKTTILRALSKAAANETLSVEFLERQRWGDEPLCPRCGTVKVFRMTRRDGERNRDYRWNCRVCRRMFTVRTSTILEETRLPLRVWVYTLWRACASEEGISVSQLARETEISLPSALSVLRRLGTAWMTSVRRNLPKEARPKLGAKLTMLNDVKRKTLWRLLRTTSSRRSRID
jgi:transposase-like protein